MAGWNLPTANAGGTPPEVPDGLNVVRLDDIVLKEHPDWAGTDKFGKPDDGDRYHFQTTLVTPGPAGFQVVYDPNSEGDPIEIDATTRTATGEKSNFAAHLSGILTVPEFAAWQAGGDVVDHRGEFFNVKVEHNKKGWPFIESFIGAAAPAVKKTKAQIKAELEAALAAADDEDGDEPESAAGGN